MKGASGEGAEPVVVGMHQGGRNGNCRSLLTAPAHLAIGRAALFLIAGGKLHDVSRDGLLIR